MYCSINKASKLSWSAWCLLHVHVLVTRTCFWTLLFFSDGFVRLPSGRLLATLYAFYTSLTEYRHVQLRKYTCCLIAIIVHATSSPAPGLETLMMNPGSRYSTIFLIPPRCHVPITPRCHVPLYSGLLCRHYAQCFETPIMLKLCWHKIRKPNSRTHCIV